MSIKNKDKIISFQDLNAWKKAHKLALTIYKETNKYPKEEQYGLKSQMRRCAVSVVSNIVEGFSRRSGKEKNQFYYTAKGSLTELHSQILISKDVNYLENKACLKLTNQIETVGKLITGLIRSSKTRL